MSELKHIGVKRRSGRYPWGSGDNAYQRSPSLRAQVKDLKAQGMTEAEIAKGLGMKTTQLRAEISLERAAQRKADAALAMRLSDKGYSNVAIGKRMGKNESTIRNLLDPVMQERALITEKTAEMLMRQVDDKKYLDVGVGVENHIGVSRTKLNTAIAQAEKQGYKVWYVRIPQMGTTKKTSIKVLTKDDVEYKDLYKNRFKIKTITEWFDDGGRTKLGLTKPVEISQDRIAIKYAEEGGTNKDGVIELRRGVKDISLGDAKYAQVRIAVEGNKFLKGMAIYSDDLPKGVDILFNTNKSKDVGIDVLKTMKEDKDNPFGAIVRQKNYIGKDGKKHLSALNIVNEEGAWAEWSKTLSSQMLSKQSPALAKQQLDLALKIKQEEFKEYSSLTNPTIKSKLLLTFGDDCDSSAVQLKAAAMPRQGSHVILPSMDIKPTEIYAPNYLNNDTVVLIRYPHGGIFEIPQLTVNNKNPKAIKTFGNAKDAVAIHPDVAKKMSGADFDGDTVLVIPNKSGQIKVSPSLKGLADFDPQSAYPGYPGMKKMKDKTKQTEMGKISNLITDMTIKGASHDEIARAVRHSMVVIDAEKHNLNYKQSFLDNGIAELKANYQGGPRKGAATLISRANSQIRVTKRKEEYRIDPKTGKKIFVVTPESYVNDKGKVIEKKTVSKRMYEVDDAYELSSGTRMESIYAEYANSLKVMGDQARKEALLTPRLKYSPSAKKVYAPQVESLRASLSIAVSNKPLERQAQLLANKVLQSKRDANPDLTGAEIKKIKGQALAEARRRVGASKQSIEITPKEWEAIQAGAISDSFLRQILNNTKLDLIKQYATPRPETYISTAKLTKARLLLDRGYTQAEVAQMVGVPTTTLMDAIDEGGS